MSLKASLKRFLSKLHLFRKASPKNKHVKLTVENAKTAPSAPIACPSAPMLSSLPSTLALFSSFSRSSSDLPEVPMNAIDPVNPDHYENSYDDDEYDVEFESEFDLNEGFEGSAEEPKQTDQPIGFEAGDSGCDQILKELSECIQIMNNFINTYDQMKIEQDAREADRLEELATSVGMYCLDSTEDLPSENCCSFYPLQENKNMSDLPAHALQIDQNSHSIAPIETAKLSCNDYETGLPYERFLSVFGKSFFQIRTTSAVSISLLEIS